MVTKPASIFQNNGSPGGDEKLIASSSMLLSVLCYSVVPLLLVWVNAEESPFLVNSVYRFGALLGALLFLFVIYRDFLNCSEVRQLVSDRLKNLTILIVIVPYFGYTAFAWSVKFVDVSLPTIIQEIWPVLYILFTERLLRREKRFLRPTFQQIVLILFGFIGFGFVIYSQEGRLWHDQILSTRSLIGIGLALLSAFIISSTAYNIKWASDLRNEFPNKLKIKYSNYKIELFCLMIAFLIGSAASAIINLLAGIAVGEKLSCLV